MPKRSKKHTEALKKIDRTLQYDPLEAMTLAVASSHVKFDETVDVAVRLGVDPRHADQMVRGTVVLPNGLGKEVKVLVFAKGKKNRKLWMRAQISLLRMKLWKRSRMGGLVLIKPLPHRI